MLIRRLKYFLLKFLRLKDSPRSAALGFVLGAISNFIPAIGFGGLVAVLLAVVFRANILASLIGHYVFAPIFPFMFYLNLRTGQLFLREQIADFGETLHNIVNFELHSLGPIAKSFSLGAGINILITGIILFLIIFPLFKNYRNDLICWLCTKKKLKDKLSLRKKNKKIK